MLEHIPILMSSSFSTTVLMTKLLNRNQMTSLYKYYVWTVLVSCSHHLDGLLYQKYFQLLIVVVTCRWHKIRIRKWIWGWIMIYFYNLFVLDLNTLICRHVNLSDVCVCKERSNSQSLHLWHINLEGHWNRRFCPRDWITVTKEWD